MNTPLTKESLFKKYKIAPSHKVWIDYDSWMLIEIYRLMNDGKLPAPDDNSVLLVVNFIDKIFSEPKWWADIMGKREDWGSLFLTAKRSIYRFADEIILQMNQAESIDKN
ncbi:MAG: hypothetical protein Q7U77_11385 [Sediminibacterium sp.]|uniref:hypothetical protein n=1 Tax=Sediminibacterium sp. TaxID=1917865 RepID=UPI0027285A8B|nr:hypothetical protein [Sediminibacterium sp.]MDO8997220.1 hypothetical protein [Sediminibacterium sp.]